MLRVSNNLPTKLFSFKHGLPGPAVAPVPNSTPARFQRGPSRVNCALLSLETNESHPRGLPRRTWGSCMGGVGICHQPGGTGTWRLWETDPDFHHTPLRFQTLFCLSHPPSARGDMSLHVDCQTKDVNIKCCFAGKKKKKRSTLMMFFRISFFPYILTSRLTVQWLLFKLTTAELQNVVFVLKTMTENFICIQMPTGLWYFNNKTAGLKAHDEKSD